MSVDYGDSAKEDVFSKVVRAGQRTYFFDVKSTRGNDLYLTITESKKRTHQDGKISYDKHKLFLYKEDFEKFSRGFEKTLSKIKSLQEGDNEFVDPTRKIQVEAVEETQFTDVNFDDLNED